jgi:hypothetical protein
MRISFFQPVSLVALITVAACSPDSSNPLAPDLAVRASVNHPVDRPLQGTCSTSIEFSEIVFLPPPNDDVLVSENVHHEGTCILALLGKSRFVSDLTVDFTVFPARTTGQSTLTTANGDLLTGTESADVSPPDDDGIFEFLGTWTFSGGTGRFANATGYADFTGNGDLNDLTTQRSLNGRLSY